MLIKNAIICDIDGEKKSDILIEDLIIKEIGLGLTCSDLNCEVIDANGAYFMPLLIDTNVKLLDGSLNAKNVKEISAQALKGGVGHIVLNADSTPAIDDEIVLEFAQNSTSHITGAKVDLMLNSLKEDSTLSNIAILLKKGAVVPFMSTVAKNNLAIKIAQYTQMYDTTLHCKAEDNSLINSGVMLEGDISSKLGLSSIPDLSEVLHVSRMIEIARHFKIKILFKSIASPRSISLISSAKKEGVHVSCEVSICHLTTSDSACMNFNTTAKLNPPLACHSDVKLLQMALSNGEIDILTSLHQPSSPLNKEVAFFDAHYGCESILEITSLYYTKLVKTGLITMSKLIGLTVQNPAKSINKVSGKLHVGSKVEAMLFDINGSKTIKNSQSLFNNEKIFGEVIATFR